MAARRLPQRLRVFLADGRVHEFLWYCVPGIAVGFVLRAAFMASMPFGYYHPDTHDFLTTVYSLVIRHHWTIHGKTTFLTPVLYLLAFFPKAPALIVIPLAQHLRGLLMVLFVGALARLWFIRWRWWIVPLTVLAAMQPAVLFWEHTLMSESGFVFCAVMLALAGSVFARWPARLTYGFLLGAMVCVAAARPEGNLWQGTGVLLVLIVYGRQWRREWRKILGTGLVALGMLSITKTSHSGLLLYSSMVQFTPDEPKVAPGFGPYILPTRDLYRAKRAERVADDVVKASRPIQAALAAYATDHPRAKLGLPFTRKQKKAGADEAVSGTEDDELPGVDLRHGNNLSDVCRRLAIEAARQHPFELPGYAWRKFLARLRDDPGGRIEDYTFHHKQAVSLIGNANISQALGRALSGSPLDTPEQAQAFVDGHYDLMRVRWFNDLEAGWQSAVNHLHLPDRAYSAVYNLPGLTVFHLLGMLGAAVALGRPGRSRRFHRAFVPTVAAAGFIVMLTAAVIPRHRFVWEPFWLLYGFFLLDSVVVVLSWLSPRRRSSGNDASAPAAEPAAL